MKVGVFHRHTLLCVLSHAKANPVQSAFMVFEETAR